MVCMALGFLAIFGDFGTWFGNDDFGHNLAGDSGASLLARLAVIVPCFTFALGSIFFGGVRFHSLQKMEYSKDGYKDWKLKNEGYGTTTDLKNWLHLYFLLVLVFSIALVGVGLGDNNHDKAMFWIASGGLLAFSLVGLYFLQRNTPNMKLRGLAFFLPFKNNGPLVKKEHMLDFDSLDTRHSEAVEILNNTSAESLPSLRDHSEDAGGINRNSAESFGAHTAMPMARSHSGVVNMNELSSIEASPPPSGGKRMKKLKGNAAYAVDKLGFAKKALQLGFKKNVNKKRCEETVSPLGFKENVSRRRLLHELYRCQ